MLSRRRGTLAAAAAAALTASAVVAAPSGAAPAKNGCENRTNNTYAKLLECVRVDGVMEHLEALQQIADDNGGNRAAQSPGYDASVDYVVDVLEAAGWSAEVVPFTYAAVDSALTQLSPDQAEFPHADATGTGEGDVTAEVVPVDVNLDPPRANSSGCEAQDFADFPTGAIALVQRGSCAFSVKALNAEAAGASAVVIFNQGDSDAADRTGVVNPTLGGEGVVDIPVVGTSFAAGQSLAQDGSTARVAVDFYDATSYNVIGELAGRTDGNVVMAGAHLDSVTVGPGINDNGSGSAGLLEVAQQMSKSRPHNTVRFAWWGAEELGLLGSRAWVDQRSESELEDIALYLNFDMIGSPNYYLGVYDADESSFAAPVVVPEGSEDIEETFESFYTLRGEPYDDSAFSGRSDYQAFIDNGIPSGGLFTGAEVVKTAEQQEIWGGTAGESFDQCYHQACDTIGNIDEDALDVNADAVAFAVFRYAASTEAVNGVPGRAIPGKFEIPAPAGPEHTFAGPLGGDEHDHEAERE
ncbi:Aminopeptidase Y (Arg, Lys, Leu preference) [Serinicoccus hydrothermalis]|uniref:Aminopeptidase Y (Arg, Lys, Leu preference) n=2 Tax=Serinicoccus hydrothermalis TaxID=1758689 RepID=A0A1B1N7L6_9MICO|nr:Aminopeptidase Y (Arg, Lys, Leu preference) [Serinicoccus hydrothermalis]